MKKILVVLAVILFTSCSDQGILTSESINDLEVLKKNYKVVVLDECEYIIYDFSSGYGGYGYMAHKGNCKNPIHNHNK